jgi:hypothetical protein
LRPSRHTPRANGHGACKKSVLLCFGLTDVACVMQVRAALVSAVYKKTLKLGPSARNKRTQVHGTPTHTLT